MKNLTFIILAVLVSLFSTKLRCQTELQDYYDRFNQLPVTTGFLLNRAYETFSDVEPFIFDSTASNYLSNRTIFSSALEWGILYNNLIASDVDSSFMFPTFTNLRTQTIGNDSISPVGILFFDTDYVHSDSIESYLLADSTISSLAPIQLVNIFAVSNLKQTFFKLKDDLIYFIINDSLYFSNRLNEIKGLEIDFNDGNTPQYFPYGTDALVAINYSTSGEKSLIYKLILDQDTLVSFSKIKIFHKTIPDIQNTLLLSLPGGNSIKGNYKITKGCDNVFDKPIIIVEGISLAGPHSKDNLIFDKYSSYWDVMKKYGYDIVTVQFENNHADIKDNAKILKKIIEEVNDLKEGYFENIVIGESMGGLISRIALKEMENGGYDHEVRLYVSFDSPHKGGNAPLSIQELIYDAKNGDFSCWVGSVIGAILGPVGFIAGYFVDEYIIEDYAEGELENAVEGGLPEGQTLQILIDANNSIPSRQMTFRLNQPDSLKHEINPDYLDFQEYLNNLGFPEICRSVALINGSNGAKTQVEANSGAPMQLGSDIFRRNQSGVEVFAKVSPITMNNFQASGIHKSGGLFSCGIDERGIFDFFEKPYDIAPGGNRVIPNKDKDGNVIDKPSFCIVPSASSIALNDGIFESPGGLFYYNETSSDVLKKKKGLIQNNFIPFDDIYAQSFNTTHINIEELGDLNDKLREREFMFENFYLQNRTFVQDEIKYFHGANSITLGKDVNPWKTIDDEKEIEIGKVKAQPGSELRITSGKTITFSPGTVISAGAKLVAKITPTPIVCPQNESSNIDLLVTHIIPAPVINIRELGPGRVEFRITNKSSLVSPRDYEWTLSGKETSKYWVGEKCVIDNLPIGQYSVTCSLFDGERTCSKVFKVLNNNKMIERIEEWKPSASDNTKLSLAVSPNPVGNSLSVGYFLEKDGSVKIEIIDLLGRTELSMAPEYKNSGFYKKVFDISNFENGFYFVVLTANDLRKIEKIVIRK